MTAPSFVHLRLHSEYSISDGTVRIDDAVAAAAVDRMPALALTDLANQFGLIKFYKAARANGVKPIAGCVTSSFYLGMFCQQGRELARQWPAIPI